MYPPAKDLLPRPGQRPMATDLDTAPENGQDIQRQMLLQLLRGQTPTPETVPLPPQFTMPKPYAPPSASSRTLKAAL